ncbi:hypothetical protein NEUTE2DRAFT_51539 [Neurospora tetrasperma FGSC 2509]|nr:hypothetical protein NEUTE2DRAFT_51539 [Neurospora tetrasperma FGSC 2509]
MLPSCDRYDHGEKKDLTKSHTIANQPKRFCNSPFALLDIKTEKSKPIAQRREIKADPCNVLRRKC